MLANGGMGMSRHFGGRAGGMTTDRGGKRAAEGLRDNELYGVGN